MARFQSAPDSERAAEFGAGETHLSFWEVLSHVELSLFTISAFAATLILLGLMIVRRIISDRRTADCAWELDDEVETEDGWICTECGAEARSPGSMPPARCLRAAA